MKSRPFLILLPALALAGCSSQNQSTLNPSGNGQPAAPAPKKISIPPTQAEPTPTPPKNMGLVGTWTQKVDSKAGIESDEITYSKDGLLTEVKKGHDGKYAATVVATGLYGYDGKTYSVKMYTLKITGDPAHQKIFEMTATKTDRVTSNAPETTGAVSWRDKDHVKIETTTPAWTLQQEIHDNFELTRKK